MFAISIDRLDSLVVCGSTVNTNGWEHNGRINKNNIIVYIKKGSCTFETESKVFHLKEKDFIIIPEKTFYRPHTDDYCKHWVAHFKGKHLGDISLTDVYKANDMSADNVLLLPQYGRLDDILLSHLKRIDEISKNASHNERFKKSIVFLNFLNCLDDSLSQSEGQLSAQQIQKYILDNYKEDISLDNISEHFHYTKQYIIKVFKESFFTTPMQFIINKRLELSKVYLAETTMKINEISAKCGFEDNNYYSRMFRKAYGVSPKQYRKSIVTSIDL